MKMAEKSRAFRARRLTSALVALTLGASLLVGQTARADGLADEAELHFQLAAARSPALGTRKLVDPPIPASASAATGSGVHPRH